MTALQSSPRQAPPPPRPRRLAALLLALLPWLWGGDCQTNVVELDSVMAVEPLSLDFGQAPLSQVTTRAIRISNPSAVDLHPQFAFTPSSDPAFGIDAPPSIVAAGDSIEVLVAYRPMITTQVTATLVLTSDSKQDPRAEVAMVGAGVDMGLPHIEVSPAAIDFGAIGQGEVARVDVTVRNSGVRDLLLDAIALDADGGGAYRLVTTAPAGFVLRPSEETQLKVAFNPLTLGAFTGSLSVASNDPAAPLVTVPLTGSGYTVPVAVLTTLDDITALEPMDAVRLEASASYSHTPGVTISSYDWHLTVRPIGSSTVLRAGTGSAGTDLVTSGSRADLLLDLAGRYEVVLNVTDSLGVSSATPAVLRLRAVPTEALHVQLVWDHPTADLDLHFVRGRVGLFDHDLDCYFSNRFPVWYPETPDANPRLDVDDQTGFGPENINAKQPAPGIITLFVHYWNSRTTGNPATTATVRVFVRGQLTAELTQHFARDEQLWSALELSWPDSIDAPVPLTPLSQVTEYRRPF